ncbi:MAG: peptide deformylase [Acidimicrobiia bacterium]|nr:peptide deformylase [Acidimicrobiia bacterium]MYH54593.1 peptide deformylase [Acidimicrobiia bacterium]
MALIFWRILFGPGDLVAIFPIRTFGDPVLSIKTKPVKRFDDPLRRLSEDMIETMYEAPGVGLAAPQIGVAKRMFVFDVGDGPEVMVNPKLVESSGAWEYQEGCLSVPGHYFLISRPAFARAIGQDLDGQPIEFAGDELLGRVLQHEIDHLDGRLLLTRLPPAQRSEVYSELQNPPSAR